MHLAHAKAMRGDIGGQNHHAKRRLIIQFARNVMQVTRQRPAGDKAVVCPRQFVDDRCEVPLAGLFKPGKGFFDKRLFRGKRGGNTLQRGQAKRIDCGPVSLQRHCLFAKPQAETVNPADVGTPVEIIPDPGRDADQARQAVPPCVRVRGLPLPQDIGIDVIDGNTGMTHRLHRLGMFVIQRHPVTRRKGVFQHLVTASGGRLAQRAGYLAAKRKHRVGGEDGAIDRA